MQRKNSPSFARHEEKRQREDCDTSQTPPKYRRISQQSAHEALTRLDRLYDSAHNLPPDQLLSPTLTKSGQEPFSLATGKRKAQSLDCLPSTKRTRLLSEPLREQPSVAGWLQQLPLDNKFEIVPENQHSMSQPPAKRSRCTDSLGQTSQSGDGTETTVSRDKKHSQYKDVNYPVILETKGSFMRSSEQGMADEDKELCEKLFTTSQSIPQDILFNNEHFSAFHSNLRGRSEARICTDLHPRIMPSAENLYICGEKEFKVLVEGYNDPWVKSIPFYGSRPQPDHTFGFKWFGFTEQQRRKLGIEPTKKSYYTAREDMYFPFLTGEVKCGKQGLDLADLPNVHSMTVALRGVIDLYRRIDRADELHRRVLGFSVSHDDNNVRIHAHYPEIDGDNITYWRESIREFSLNTSQGRDRWVCFQFSLNVFKMFALPFLERLKKAIDELPDPITQSFELSTTFDEISVQSSQDDASAIGSQDESMKKPSGRGLNAPLRNVIQGLQRQLEQQRQDAKQQRKEMKEREAMLLNQLEQQRKDFEQQRKDSEQQRKDSEQQRKDSEQRLMEMLGRQSEQITQLLDKQRSMHFVA